MSARSSRTNAAHHAVRSGHAVCRQCPWRILVVLVLVSLAVPPVAVVASPPPLPADKVEATPLSRELDALLGNEPGLYGIVVMAPDGDTLYSRNRDVPFVAASLFKLVVMVSVFEQEAAGTLTRDEELPGWGTIADALFAMIVHSDNGSSVVLIDRVGGIDVVNETANRLGLNRTRLDVGAGWVEDLPQEASRDSTTESIQQGKAFVADSAAGATVDVTTPDDMARFFRLLLEGQVVNADASKEMLELLAKQQIRDRLPVLLPPNTAVAHKTGNLPSVIHDAGIITTPVGPLIVAALAEAMPAEGRAFEVIQQLALVVYETAERPLRWEEPPRGATSRAVRSWQER